VAERVAAGRVEIAGFRDDLKAFLGFEDHSQPTANHLMVVGEDDLDGVTVRLGIHRLHRTERRQPRTTGHRGLAARCCGELRTRRGHAG
jgi:hypothetical protein